MSWSVELVEVEARIDGREVLRGVSFGAPAAAVTALVGPRAAGKTTVVRLIAGLERPDVGAVLVRGHDVSRARGRTLRRLRRGMSVMFQGGAEQGFGLFESATARENVAYAVRAAGRSPGRRLDADVGEYLDRLGLSGREDARPPDLSVPERKRLALARALALHSPVVVLDDFDGGLERDAVPAICALLREEQARRGAGYLVTTRDEDAAQRVADHVHVLRDGRCLARGTKFHPGGDAPRPAPFQDRGA